MQIRIKDEENKKLKDALLKFRDLNTEEKTTAVQAVEALKVARSAWDCEEIDDEVGIFELETQGAVDH